MIDKKLDFNELQIISHSLGIDLYNAVMSLKLKDKKLPLSFYRNYYNASSRQAEIVGINKLIEKGFMHTIRADYYHVTEKGINQFKKQFYELAIYISKSKMDINYLIHRINFYCDFRNYNFCENNAGHVIEYAYKYFADKEYVSHTTKDVILTFKTELKKLVKERIGIEITRSII